MARVIPLAVVMLAVAACQPTIPDSAAGVTDDTLPAAPVVRSAALEPASTRPAPVGPATASSQAVAAQPRAASPQTSQSDAPLPASVLAAVENTAAEREQRVEQQARSTAAATNSGVAPVQASPSNPAPALVSNPGISSEQDFETVSARRSIENDAQRLAANRAQYQVITPTSLPTRPGTNQPNIVQYAIQTNNPVGTQIYSRPRQRNTNKHTQNCAAFASADEAQITFLNSGGPRRDRRSLDPDGDGFACSWDPTPFRAVRQARGPISSIVQPMAISTEQ